MIDRGISKLTLIGIVALLVVGPEKLPGIARTLGTLVGRAQRYINDLKAEVGNVAGLDELRQMKQTVEQTAWDVERQMHDAAGQVRHDLRSVRAFASPPDIEDVEDRDNWNGLRKPIESIYRPRRNWRLKRSALPHWYKARHHIRTRALSGAARVARYRPPQKPFPD